MTNLFVTGTDTDVGKTFISAILALHLDMDYFKPVQSGWIDGTDSEFMNKFNINTHKEIYKLKAPLSPHLAANLEDIEIDIDKINIPDSKKGLIVEGAGGVMVPINNKLYVIDVIKKLNLPTIIVSRSKLGTINHTLLTIKALKDAGIEILGIIFNGDRNIDNENSIAIRSGIHVLGNVNNMSDIAIDSIQNDKNCKQIAIKIKNLLT